MSITFRENGVDQYYLKVAERDYSYRKENINWVIEERESGTILRSNSFDDRYSAYDEILHWINEYMRNDQISSPIVGRTERRFTKTVNKLQEYFQRKKDEGRL